MAIEQQDNGANSACAPDQSPSPITAAGASRRRFAKTGLGASGVILTLTSQPGMAQSVCKSMSGSLSGGLQSQKGPAPVCAGLSPGYWKNHFPQEASSGTPMAMATKQGAGASVASALFGSIFACDSGHVNFRDTSLYNMLSHQDFDQDNVGMHLVASYFNVIYGKTSFLTVAALQTVWSEFQATGYYRPTAAVKWTGFDIVVYLKGTMA